MEAIGQQKIDIDTEAVELSQRLEAYKKSKNPIE